MTEELAFFTTRLLEDEQSIQSHTAKASSLNGDIANLIEQVQSFEVKLERAREALKKKEEERKVAETIVVFLSERMQSTMTYAEKVKNDILQAEEALKVMPELLPVKVVAPVPVLGPVTVSTTASPVAAVNEPDDEMNLGRTSGGPSTFDAKDHNRSQTPDVETDEPDMQDTATTHEPTSSHASNSNLDEIPCAAYNKNQSCSSGNQCSKPHVCAYCRDPSHTFTNCTRKGLICVLFNKNQCNKQKCSRLHACLFCLGDHSVVRCNRLTQDDRKSLNRLCKNFNALAYCNSPMCRK
jgi:hypothetical protein